MKKAIVLSHKLFFSLVFLLLPFLGLTQTSPHTITTTTTFTVPAGVYSLQVEAWGGGGAGGGTTTDTKTTGGGGGGGAYTKATPVLVNPGDIIIVTIGAAGTSVSGANGNPGGVTTFASSVPVTANGGAGGEAGTALVLNGAGGVGGIGTFNGGTGGTGNSTSTTQGYSGGGGGSAGSAGDGGNAFINTGGAAGPGTPSGFAGASGRNSSGNGGASSGTNYGAGGAGGNNNVSTARSGGNGTKGKVIISWNIVGTREINLRGNSTNIADGDSSPTTTDWTNFGSAEVTSGTITRTFTIQNIGGATLSIGAISITGTNAADFTVTTLPAATVAAGSSTTFVVTFDPSAIGTRTATISIVNDDSNENPYDFGIQGTGAYPEINVQGNSVSITDGNTTPGTTDSTDFGSVEVDSGTIIKTFTIQNTGAGNITVGAISFSGTNAADFTVSSLPSTTITTGSSTTFTVTFTPSALGLRTATISIINSDSDENPYDFAIQGTGSQAFFDSDGDGIYDNADVDDDNDGILDTTEETNCNNSNGYKANYKFLNETFGASLTRATINTTYAATTTYCFQDATPATSCEGGPTSTSLDDGKYTVGPSAQIATWAANQWYLGVDHTSGDTNGRMAMFNASNTAGTFYTALITGALPNLPITYSFWVLNLDRTDASGIATRKRPNIKVEFRDINDVVLQTISTGNIEPTTNGNLAGDWYQFTANLNLNVTTFKVVFINNNTGGAGNDLALDDITITQTLCDSDNDGVADLFDLDADNDGIEDVIEAGLGSISNGKGKIDVTWVDSNVNGLLDSAESTAALAALDSDGDGIPNYRDLDSDNDSLFDVDESGAGNTNAAAGFVNGDGDITGDGLGDGAESEVFRFKDTDGNGVNEFYGDGILDIYDYGTGANQYGNLNQGIANANPATTYLTDTDSDGIPDYLDVMSNGSTFDIAPNKLIYDYKTLDANNDGIIDGTTDTDKDGIRDTFDTNTTYYGSPRDLHTKLFLDFDGRNDYGQSTAVLGGLANASLMAWIDLDAAFATDGIIVGQNNFQIRITNARKLEAVVNGTTATYNTTLNVSQWYNVAAVYGGGFLKLYLNGNLVVTEAASGSISADTSLLTIGKNPSASDKFFKGKIDEVRVFNCALTDSQLQRMVYQEIKNSGSEIGGETIPKNVATSPASLPFTNLLRYYRMDNYKDDIIDDLTTAAIDVIGTKIYNHKNIFVQQAPMPFLTERTGDFATAVNSPTKEIRGLDITDQDWSIVKVQHDISETSNTIDLGMIVDSGKNIVMDNDTEIHNDWYLKLDGKIDLVGKSQLVQTTESDLDVTSSGSIERDQQGQTNLYNYNYWSSPVNPINTTANNTDYTVAGVMKDGTSSTPQNINWIGGYDGSATTPISLARYWLFKFDSATDAYANWVQITEGTALRVGLGYTLKGSGAATATQNFTFVGKPNNGTITNNIGSGQLLLVGNPYPSAIDAYKFIDDNTLTVDQSVTDGTLYFWQHAPENNTHLLADYLGSYGVLNRTGGVPPIVPTLITGGGSTAKIPNQYIPVGQGFFVYGTATGGGVQFNNSQRAFVKEDNAASNSLFKTKATTKTTPKEQNNNDTAELESYKKIRLGYNTANGYHRQVLLAFMDEKATKKIDPGYDGEMLDNYSSDMYFLNKKIQLVIQGEGFFDANDSFPIGVKVGTEGKVSFTIDNLENFEPQQPVYIYDKLTRTYHNIRQQSYEVVLPVGTNDSRFSLRFRDKTKNTEQNTISDIQITHIQKGNIIEIDNPLLDVRVEKINLFNIAGQSVFSWNIENQNQQNIRIPIRNVNPGMYIVKMKTSKGESGKKIIIP